MGALFFEAFGLREMISLRGEQTMISEMDSHLHDARIRMQYQDSRRRVCLAFTPVPLLQVGKER